MSKKLLIVNGSPRKNGVDAAIAKLIADRVKEHGYETEIVNICEMKIGGCRACMVCKKTGKCAQDDDMIQMYERIRSSDMLILASPVDVGFAGTIVATLNGVAEEAFHAVAIVLVVFGRVDAALGSDAMGAARRVLDAEDVYIEA